MEYKSMLHLKILEFLYQTCKLNANIKYQNVGLMHTHMYGIYRTCKLNGYLTADSMDLL